MAKFRRGGGGKSFGITAVIGMIAAGIISLFVLGKILVALVPLINGTAGNGYFGDVAALVTSITPLLTILVILLPVLMYIKTKL